MEYKGNIEKITLQNHFYRKVLHTTKNMQLVVMKLQSKEEIGLERHLKASQFIRIESGKAKAIIGDKTYYLKDGDAIIIPPKKYHNIINYGDEDLHLYSIYTPPEHSPQIKQKKKEQ
jgi:mannose-6-phosphate isomerase-like protein (cupin superfamily)